MRLAWRLGIFLLILAGLANLAGAITESYGFGTYGFTTDQIGSARSRLRVVAVSAGSPAALAGIHPGDVIIFAPTPANIQAIYDTVARDRITLRDGRRSIDLTAVPARVTSPIALILAIGFAKLAFAAMAALVIWRRPEDAAARSLALFLATFSFGMSYDLAAIPYLWARILSQFLVPCAFFTGMLALLSFACRFPSLPSHGMRNALAKAFPAIAIVGAVAVLVPLGLTYLSHHDYYATFPAIAIPPVIAQGCIILAIFAALVNAYLTSTPQERPRMRWLVGTLIAGFSGIVVIVACALAGLDVTTLSIQYFALTVLVIPFGLAYVILRHRMLDIAFVVNRAVVYTGVSAVVVGSFIVFEWILGHFFESSSRASSALQLAGALVLGFSVRYIHNKVDKYVDDIFFRERHAAEAAVRRFAHEALLITDADDLVRKTTEVAQQKMRLSACAFFFRRNAEFVPLRSTFALPSSVGENDYAVLEMRTWHAPVSLHETNSALPGELALPMIVRGTLAGFLLCGEKQNHEAFAPDEREALAQLARDAGMALDSLRIREIERELAARGLPIPGDATGGAATAL